METYKLKLQIARTTTAILTAGVVALLAVVVSSLGNDWLILVAGMGLFSMLVSWLMLRMLRKAYDVGYKDGGANVERIMKLSVYSEILEFIPKMQKVLGHGQLYTKSSDESLEGEIGSLYRSILAEMSIREVELARLRTVMQTVSKDILEVYPEVEKLPSGVNTSWLAKRRVMLVEALMAAFIMTAEKRPNKAGLARDKKAFCEQFAPLGVKSIAKRALRERSVAGVEVSDRWLDPLCELLGDSNDTDVKGK